MYSRDVAEYYAAKQKAASRLYKGWIKPADLPSNAEIRDQVQVLARMHEGPDRHQQRLLQMRVRAAWWLEKLAGFHPKLIGSVLTGSIRNGSDIDIHVFAANPHSITTELEDLNLFYQLERKQIVKDGQQRVFTHIHVRDEFEIELTVYHPSQLGYRFRSSITNKPIESAGLNELNRLIALEHEVTPETIEAKVNELTLTPDRITVFQSLLVPLESVHQNLKYHPEGDALYHSLQVFDLARDCKPYDEEFLLAALLHDVGKAIDRRDHVAAGMEALEGFVSERTMWLIEHHMDTHAIADGTIGARAKRRLAESPWYEDLIELGECDRGGRVAGAEAPELEEALDYIENIEDMFG
ncbi:hypothetical protein LF1_14930 [Rubripirellula obstinata]|uniref:HD domain-containing protein n=2 Tax=Rubripirellula obstinata TaxID=406547 RepID=A0A5B1CCS2_9BACT|nr:hypothetical protein LF1_14930 [Rubripirellula obstinata]